MRRNQISESGVDGDFYYPQPIGGELRWVVAWSRIFADEEYLCAINTNAERPLTVWVTIDHSLHDSGGHMTCLYATDAALMEDQQAVAARNGSAIQITVPPAGVVIYH